MNQHVKKGFWIAFLGILACSEHNPDHILNRESALFDSSLAVDADRDGIADGLEPYWESCGGDARCAADRVVQERKMSSSVAGSSSGGLLSSSAENTSAAASSSSHAESGSSAVSSSSAEKSSSSGDVLSSSVGTSSAAASSSSEYLLTVSDGVIVGMGTNTARLASGTSVSVIARVGGLDRCPGSWSYPSELDDVVISGDTMRFTMPRASITVRNNATVCLGQYSDERDGRIYSYKKLTLTLGGQSVETYWLTQNLRYDSPDGGEFCYGNLPQNCDLYGMLYRRAAAQQACPAGWRLPTAEEFLAAADSLNLQSAGRATADDPPQFDYLGDNSRRAYWVLDSERVDFSKNCTPSATTTCGYILTNERGSWAIASDALLKAYPVRCILIY